MKALSTFVLLALTFALFADEPVPVEPAKPAAQPHIDVAFVLDTTGSMSGLINAAQEKIWAIANKLATTEPAPRIRLALIGYRDRGDAYVTTVTDFTDDLDAVYTKLMAFDAGGGGDGPESVNQALHEAVTKLTWDQADATFRVIYLVGDAPPHMDYRDDVKYQVSCRLAAKAGIIVNTIQCGTMSSTAPIWQEIAKLSEGSYFQVEQSGGAILTKTPFDDDLAKLSRELDATRLYYGSKEVRNEQAAKLAREDVLYDALPASAVARRATYNASAAGEINFAGKQELVSDVENERVDLAKIPEEQLPEELRQLTPEERTAFIETRRAERAKLQEQIAELTAKRQANIEEQLKARPAAEAGSLDAAIQGSLREQAAKKGIAYSAEIAH